MRKAAADKCRTVARAVCRKEGVPFSKAVLRSVKKQYASLPRTKRHLVG